MAKKQAGLINGAYKTLALACLKNAVQEKDFELLEKNRACSERLDLLCAIAGIDRDKFTKRLFKGREEYDRNTKREKKRLYMREWIRRRREAETAEGREKRLAKAREYARLRYIRKHRETHYES